MGRYRFSVDVAAPIEQVFDLWTDLERSPEWIEGLTKVTDVTGPVDQAGTRYTSWFGSMQSRTEVVEAERPRLFRTRFGTWLLRGETTSTFETVGAQTRLTEVFDTVGIIAAISAWIFAHGSYRGSFRGELEAFVRIAEREARQRL